MKALSVRAPFWWFILHGGKDIENRSWNTNFRGTVYLHAGKWFKEEQVYYDWQFCAGISAQTVCMPQGLTLSDLKQSCGCIVGKVDIVECIDGAARPLFRPPWFQGRYAFCLKNPVAFDKPIPFKGALGFFDVPEGIESTT